MRVYVAGPYTGAEEANVSSAIGMAEKVLWLGHVPFVPHFAHYWHAKHPHEYTVWMEWCLSWLAVCDCVLVLGMSPGVAIEVKEATDRGKPVFYSLDELATASLKSLLGRKP